MQLGFKIAAMLYEAHRCKANMFTCYCEIQVVHMERCERFNQLFIILTGKRFAVVFGHPTHNMDLQHMCRRICYVAMRANQKWTLCKTKSVRVCHVRLPSCCAGVHFFTGLTTIPNSSPIECHIDRCLLHQCPNHLAMPHAPSSCAAYAVGPSAMAGKLRLCASSVHLCMCINRATT